MMEGTRIADDMREESEELVSKESMKIVSTTNRLVLTDFNFKGVDRLRTSLKVAKDNDRKLDHWKGRPVIALEDWIQIRGHLPYRLEYFPDDFEQSLTYMELPYYLYEFERKKRRRRREGGQMDG